MQIITYKDYEEALKSRKTVMMQYTASWCNPCKINAPHLKQIAEKHEQFVNVHTVDVDHHADIVEKEKVSSIPAILVYKDGIRTHTLQGVKAKEERENTIDMPVPV